MTIDPIIFEIFQKLHDFEMLLVLEQRAPDRLVVEQMVLPGGLEPAHRVDELNVAYREIIDLSGFS